MGSPAACGVAPFPIGGNDGELSHTCVGGLQGKEDRCPLVPCTTTPDEAEAEGMAMRLGRHSSRGTMEFGSARTKRAKGWTGAGCEALVCKRLGQAGLAGQVQACAAGARQQHV